ncbi:MAG: Crp/Fnr family transcriptional regulator [Halieaceae bacterium]
MQKVQNLHDWVSELSDAVRDEVISSFVDRNLIAGEFLYRQGDPAESCFQVTEGRIKVCNTNFAGQELVHTYLLKGDCVGDWSLLIDEPRMNYAVACGVSAVSVLRKSDFMHLYMKHAEIPRAISRVMARRLRLIFMLTEDASLLPLRERLARAVIRTAHALGEKGEDGSVTIENISHDELAKMVGATRPSVGRELKKLEREGAIRIQYGKLIISNFAAFGAQYDHLLSVEPVTPDYD